MLNKSLLILLLLSQVVQAQQKVSWPNHKKAVIVLTYDDALNSQLDVAVPQLDSAHLTGTFFLTGVMDSLTAAKWKMVGAKGHELANHTLYHPCSPLQGDENTPRSDKYTIRNLVCEIGVMNNFLNTIDNKTDRTYAYPCAETTVNGLSYVDTLRKSGLIKYARVGGDETAVITDFKSLDKLQVPSWGLEGNNTGKELIAFAEKVQNSGGLGIFMFHGIGSDYITTPTAAHRELLKFLEKNKDEIWVTTFQQAMDYISKTNE
jgi:peptidoglycan/xylan/chitin deacetylase (PgdA/CDA1 family)